MSLRFEDIRVGDTLPLLEKPPITTMQLVQYAGASGDFNRIHYDEPFAKEGGFPSVIAHGMLSMAFFGQLIGSWAGATTIARLSARFKAVTFPGDRITVGGEVTAARIDSDGERTLELKLYARKSDGTITLDGTATLRFPH